MSKDPRKIVLFNGTATASGVGSEIPIPCGYEGCIVLLNVTAASGTSPTLDVKIQDVLYAAASTDLVNSCPTGTKFYDDFIAFNQATNTGSWVARVNPSAFTAAGAVATVSLALQDGTMSAGTGKVGHLGCTWRVKYVITATTPSFTFSVVAHLTQ